MYTYLREYIKRTESLRGEEKSLLISYIRPHKWVSKDTITRCVKIVIQQAGVDERYLNLTVQGLLPLVKHIVLMCRWHRLLRQAVGRVTVSFKNSSYNKPIDLDQDFGQAILASAV